VKRAIVLVDHGSRRAEANAVLVRVAELVRERMPGCVVEVAHMTLAPPDLAGAIEACVAAGAAEIVVHPYFLAPGEHAMRDIPAIARAAADRHLGVSIRVSEPLGVHPALVDAILDRVAGV
jgi:sirohydrochlorin ferrochelatase